MPSAARARKRGRAVAEAPPPSTAAPAAATHDDGVAPSPSSSCTVCFSAIDSHKLFEVSRCLLDTYDCRLTALARRERGTLAADGRTFYRSGLRRAVLLTILQSLEFGKLTLADGCTVGEALTAMDANCVPYSERAPKATIRPPALGVAFAKREQSLKLRLEGLCTALADALLCWPRLEGALEACIGGHEPIAATPTACYVLFAEKRTLADRLDRERPYLDLLAAVGTVHARMAGASFAIPPTATDEAAFRRLAIEVNGSPALASALDLHPSQSDRGARLDRARADRFSNWVRQTIVENVSLADAARAPGYRFASAVSCLTTSLYNDASNLGAIFSGACANVGLARPRAS